METEIKDIVFKKDVNVKHKHFRINNNIMYISEKLLHELKPTYSYKDNRLVTTNIYVLFNYDIAECKVYFRKNYNGEYIVCGRSGNRFFDNTLYQFKKDIMNLRIQQKVHKKIIELYLETKLSRIEKLKKLMNG